MNMSYCRWQNTLIDLRDCYRAAAHDDCLDFDSDLSNEERHAALEVLQLCQKMAERYSDLIPATTHEA